MEGEASEPKASGPLNPTFSSLQVDSQSLLLFLLLLLLSFFFFFLNFKDSDGIEQSILAKTPACLF